MEITCASARAHPNIAFVKYWGNRDDLLRIPRNGSISMNLAELHTTTEVPQKCGLTRLYQQTPSVSMTNPNLVHRCCG